VIIIVDVFLYREMEKEEEAEKEKEKKRVKRLQRKNRDGMTALLDELHEQVIIKTDIVDPRWFGFNADPNPGAAF
jgi:hypothetical protein